MAVKCSPQSTPLTIPRTVHFHRHFNDLDLALWVVHKTPTADPSPSVADVDMTKQVVEAGRALRICVHDHLVVARHGTASFRALGLL